MTTPNFNEPALKASADLIRRTGARSFEIGYDDEVTPVEWYAKVFYGDQEVTSDHHLDPVVAADTLARQLLDGALCVHCKKRITFDHADERRCFYARIGSEWLRACEVEFPGDGPVPTKRRLAAVLQNYGAPREMTEAALDGYYDDFESPLEFPIVELVQDLGRLGLTDLVERAKQGDFDATPAESKAWASSPEGRASIGEVTSAMGNRAQRRARKREQKRKGSG